MNMPSFAKWRKRLFVYVAVGFGLFFIAIVVPLVGEYRHEISRLASRPFVRQELGRVQSDILSGKKLIPAVVISSEPGDKISILISPEGNVVIFGKSGRIGFIAHSRQSNGRVVWHCQSIFSRISWDVPCYGDEAQN